MIEITIDSEFGSYKQKYNCGHRVNYTHMCIDAYKDPPECEEWLSCPCCGLKPKVWLFGNGRSTACGCGNSVYDHFSICAESIMSVHTRCSGNLSEYHTESLRESWNEYCQTGIPTVIHGDLMLQGKW